MYSGSGTINQVINMAQKKLTKQSYIMIDSANRFLRQHGINEETDHAFMVVEQMLRDSDIYRGFTMDKYIQFNSL